MNRRYSRHIILNEIGVEGQAKLNQAHVCIIGCGGLGSIAAPYLAGAGIGHITLVDGDIPDISNLHRQVFYNGNEQTSKAKLLAEHLRILNPDINVDFHPAMLTKQNIGNIINSVDLVLECTDALESKYLCNDFCHMNGIPMVYASIHKFEGYISLFENKDSESIHLRDIFPEADSELPKCSEVGVLNTIAGIIGLLQANEAIKYILGIGSNLVGQYLTYDILENAQHIIRLRKTWNQDMSAKFENSQYTIGYCLDVPEITLDEYLKDQSQFELINILEHDEIHPLNLDYTHIPLSEFDVNEWKADIDRSYIFCCKSGQRSIQLVSQLLKRNRNQKIYSLIGGLDKHL